MRNLGVVAKLGLAIMGLLFIILLPLGFSINQIFSNFYFSSVREDVEQLSEKYASAINSLDNESLLNMFETLAQFTNTKMFILDANGIVIANSGIQELPRGTKIKKEEWLGFQKGEEVNTEYLDSTTDIHYLLVGQPIYSGHHVIGGVFVLSPVNNIYESLYHIRGRLALAIIGAFILSLGFTYILSKTLSLPLLKMESATRKISKGKLDTRVTILSNDEIGSLGKAINDLAVELQDYRNNRSEFFANISHELRTPITYLEGYASILKNKKYKDEEEMINCTLIIEQEAKRMSALINDLFELSKMEEGKLHLQIEPIDIQEVLDNIIIKTKIKAEEKQLLLNYESEDTIPLIYGDGARMEQIFLNLVENAIRYTDTGFVNVKLKCEKKFVQILVEDSGKGIPPEDLPFIFERFFRVEKSRARNLGGTGLGLAIVKNLVSLQGGSITVTSTLGGGSKFKVAFPLE